MPRAAKKPKIDKDAIYICWMSGSAEVDGQTVSFHEGERLRGDSPAVQGCPQYFVLDGTLEGERPNAWTAIVERSEADRPPVPEHDALVVLEPVPLQREDVRTLNREVTVLVGPGQEKKQVTYQAGTVFDARSELCGRIPGKNRLVRPRTEAHKLVRRWVEAINGRDLTALLELAHPDIECQPLELSSRPVYRGRAGLTEWILELSIAAPAVQRRIERVQTLSAEWAAAFGTVVANGEDVSPYVLLAGVRDGKVAAMRSHLGDKPTMEQLGLP